ncbi:MAG: signal peptidase II [Acidobacteriaceae bacterium]
MSDSVHHYEPMTAPTTRNWRPLLILISLLVVGLDRLSKLWVVHHVHPGGAITVIPHVFRITHVMNTGAAFSLFSESASPELVRNSLIGFSVFAVLVVLVLLWRIGQTLTTTSVALALILGGALGNMYDRIRYEYVVDFLEVHIIHYHWPDFNVADSCIVIGALLLALEIFRPVKKNIEL